jgi:hypothetical protein
MNNSLIRIAKTKATLEIDKDHLAHLHLHHSVAFGDGNFQLTFSSAVDNHTHMYILFKSRILSMVIAIFIFYAK